jgi:hypothetical protein
MPSSYSRSPLLCVPSLLSSSLRTLPDPPSTILTQGSIEKIAAFLGVELAASELSVVREKCSFEHMKVSAALSDHSSDGV